MQISEVNPSILCLLLLNQIISFELTYSDGIKTVKCVLYVFSDVNFYCIYA